MKTTRTLIMSLPITELVSNPIQGPWRTDGKQTTEDLTASIAEHGVLSLVLVAKVKGVNYLFDGHRRTAVAASLGYMKMRCSVIEAESIGEAERLFAEVDRATKKQTGRDRLYAWAHTQEKGLYLRALHASQAKVIQDFVSVLGEDLAVEYANRPLGTNPGSVSIAREIDRQIRAYVDDVPLRRILLWCLQHSPDAARTAARSGQRQKINRIARCINENVRFEFKLRGPAKRDE